MQNLSAKDFYNPTKFNQDTKNQLWMSLIADSHDCTCDCDSPFAHLLASIFPPGHKDRDLTINQILQRDYQQKCHSGGADAKDHGLAVGHKDIKEEHTEEKENQEEEELDALFAAAADIGEGTR